MQPNKTKNILIQASELASLLKQKPTDLTIINFNYCGDKWDHIFQNERIPTARYIHIDEIGDKSLDLPKMLPTKEKMIQVLKENDIGINDRIICYGDDNQIGACRGYWMLSVFNFQNVQILNGTFELWKKQGFEIEKGTPTWISQKRKRSDADFDIKYNKELVVDMAGAREAVKQKVQMLDARDSVEYGNGHIPGVTNIHCKKFYNELGEMAEPDQIKKIFAEHGIDLNKRIVSSCLTGMTGSVDYTAGKLAGAQDISVYDGSFKEWSKHPENPVEKSL